MVFITGDTHGDFTRIERFCERFSPTSDDITNAGMRGIITRKSRSVS